MAETTEIAWCDATFNPWIGCTKVSPGCDNCYAARQDGFRHWTPQGWGAGMPRKRTSEHNWSVPVTWNGLPFFECKACGNRQGVKARAKQGELLCNACGANSWKDARRRVFCASLADVFDNEVDPAWRADLFELIGMTPNLDWLLLTKRIGNAARMIEQALIAQGDGATDAMAAHPLPNVWLGATIVNQEEADRDIPKLLATPARVRFLSMEPLLGPVNLTRIPVSGHGHHEFDPIITANVLERVTEWPALPQVDWVIVGGESGHGARPMVLSWADSLVQQCKAAAVPVFVKQLGVHPVHDSAPFAISDRKGANLDDWPEDLRVREFPEVAR